MRTVKLQGIGIHFLFCYPPAAALSLTQISVIQFPSAACLVSQSFSQALQVKFR